MYWGLFYGAWGRSEGLPRLLQLGEPGPRGGVGEGKSKYLRYLEDKFRDLHALRPEASADNVVNVVKVVKVSYILDFARL